MHHRLKLLPRFVPPLRFAIRTLNSRYRKAKIAMFHTGRCGSTVLGRMLNQHPEVFWGSEIFTPSMKKNLQESPGYARKTIRNSEDSAVSRVYGFETKYLPFQHLCRKCVNLSLDEYVALLRHLGFTKFVVLQRENYLRRAISAEVARKRSEWQTRTKTNKATRVHIDPMNIHAGRQYMSMVDLFRCIDKHHERLRELLDPGEAVFLGYEKDVLDDPGQAYQKILEFLGLDPFPATVDLRRTNPFPLDELVSNLDETKKALENTKYSWMLDD